MKHVIEFILSMIIGCTNGALVALLYLTYYRTRAFVWRSFTWGFRSDFMLSYDSDMYYDGPFHHLNLGWVWFAWNRGGLPYLFQEKK